MGHRGGTSLTRRSQGNVNPKPTRFVQSKAQRWSGAATHRLPVATRRSIRATSLPGQVRAPVPGQENQSADQPETTRHDLTAGKRSVRLSMMLSIDFLAAAIAIVFTILIYQKL
jgi:hypothetical protein